MTGGAQCSPQRSQSALKQQRALLLWAHSISTPRTGWVGWAGLNPLHQEAMSPHRASQHCPGEQHRPHWRHLGPQHRSYLLRCTGYPTGTQTAVPLPDPAGVALSPRNCISNRFPGDAHLASPTVWIMKDALLKRFAFWVKENTYKGDQIHLLEQYFFRKRGYSGLNEK